MLAEGVDFFQWVRDPLHGALSVVATSGVAYFSHLMWQKVHHKVVGHDAPDLAPPVDWADNKIAQAYPADALRRRLQVADGTRIIVVDRAGVLQSVDFTTGHYSAREVEDRLNRSRIGNNSGAEALQYRTTGSDLLLSYSGLRSEDDYFDVELSLRVNVQVDSRHPERLMSWRMVTMERVKSTVEDDLKPHAALAIRSLAAGADDFELRLQERKSEFESCLNTRLAQNGLLATLTAVSAQSVDCRRNHEMLHQIGEEQRRVSIEKLARMARLEKARGDAEADEAVKTLIQEGRLNDLSRMKEIDEAKAYQRERVEAAQVIASAERQSQGPRHEVLVDLAGLREKRKPFAVDLRVVAPGGGSRDIQIHPPAYAAQNRMGSALQLSVTSEISGYLYVLNLGTSGKLWRLLPNPWRTENRIEANRPVLVPSGDFELKFEGAPGTEVVMAIVSPRPVEKLDKLPVNADGMSLSPEAAARDIRVVGQQLSGLDNWAEATLFIQTGAGQAGASAGV